MGIKKIILHIRINALVHDVSAAALFNFQYYVSAINFLQHWLCNFENIVNLEIEVSKKKSSCDKVFKFL